MDLSGSRSVTVQWCAIEESDTVGHPKGQHNFGMILSGKGHNTSIHHNLFAHHMRRAPLCGVEVLDYRNNVVANYFKGASWRCAEACRHVGAQRRLTPASYPSSVAPSGALAVERQVTPGCALLRPGLSADAPPGLTGLRRVSRAGGITIEGRT